MDPVEAKVIRHLLERLEAQSQLLVCYRVGKQPSEKTFAVLEKTAPTVEYAKKILADRLPHRKP